MNKTKKLLSVVLAIVMALSCMSMTASAAKTAYKTVDELTALDAYSPYGQVTRLSTEERTSIIFDALDGLLAPMTGLNMGSLLNVNLVVTKLTLDINLTSVDGICASFDSIRNLFKNGLFSVAKAILNFGVLENLNVDSWQTGMTRDGTAQFTILSEIVEVLSAQSGLIYNVLDSGELDLGMIASFLKGVDLSSVTDLIGNIPGLIKGIIYPMIERWDDNLAVIKELDASIAGTSENYTSVEAVVNWRVSKLFTDNMSITTVKYDANGNMTSEHTGMPISTTAPGTPSDSSPRCYYHVTGTTPGSVMTVYHIVDEAEAKTLAKTPDKVNGSPAAYTYFKEAQTYTMAQEVEGSDTYVWKATDDWGNTWSMKWYNDNSPLLPNLGFTVDLTTMSAGELLYKFIPVVFENMAPVVLNGSIKKILAEFFGAKFTYVGDVGSDEVNALPDASNAFFTEEQGEYLWEWSNYAVINGNHYYRFEDQIFAGDISKKNNYFDIINWNFEITGDFMNEFIPADTAVANGSDRLLLHVNDFLVKVANTVLLPSASTADTLSDFTAEWELPTFAAGNENLVKNIKALAQEIIGLAPQHIFGSDYATNERCYVDLMLSSDNDTVLVGIAATLVDAIMPSMTLPGKSDILASGAKVGAILAAVVREFAAYLAPEYNFDALIYTSFENGTKKFVSGKDSGYWFDVILTMGINVGFEYLRAFGDMGEGTAQWDAFVSNVGYGVDGKTYAAGTTQEALNAEWEGMLDYIIDWALSTDYEWTWKMANIVDTTGLTINLTTTEDPFAKIQTVLGSILPVDEILYVEPATGESKIEHFLRQDLILGIVDLKWDHLINTIQLNGTNKYFRTANVLDQLAALLKVVVNNLFAKMGSGASDSGSDSSKFELIPAAVKDFDTLANQDNIAVFARDLIGALYTALITNKAVDTVFPFLNFILGWKTDPQQIADPQIWTEFRDGNDYAYLWGSNGVTAGSFNIGDGATKIKIRNNSAGMLETHRNSSVTDHAYDIEIKSMSVDSDAKNKLTFSYGDGYISPYETLDVTVGGTYQGDEAVTVTIAYEYIGKDGKAIGGTQYTSLSFLISSLYEDANIDGRFDGDDDKDYAGIDQYKKYQFTEDIYGTVTNFEPTIFATSGTTGATGSRDFGGITAPDHEYDDCDNIKVNHDMSGLAPDKFDYITDRAEGQWEATKPKEGSISGFLYKAASGVTADTAFDYGIYDMGRYAIKYGSDSKVWEIQYIYYNDYDVDKVYADNKNNGYNANQGVDSAIYNEYNAAWNDIVKYATYPMMTTAAGSSSSIDYVSAIMPKIEPAIERFEAAKEAYEEALANVGASGSSASLPSYVQEMASKIDDDFINGKEINFQDYDFYEYFNYQDVKVAGENLYRTYLAPDVMDTYYIQGSGIREAELDLVMDAETNGFIAAGIAASRLTNDQDAINASIAAHDEWKMPTTSVLIVEDMASKIEYYKQFLAANAEDNDHVQFLNKEISYVEAQNLVEADYTENSWADYAKALAEAKAVAAGSDKFSAYNSRIYDVKYNLMVAYKQLLLKEDSLFVKGDIATIRANIETANAIFASLAAGDGVWVLAADYEGEADAAYAQLISALGYEYQARYSENDVEVQNGTKTEGELKYNADGSPMKFDLYADSALEYANNDRPNRQGNQAKVDAANEALEAAIANFETTAVLEPNTLVLNENAPFEAIIDTVNCGEYTGAIYGFDTLGYNDEYIVDGTIADFVTTAYGDDYLEVVVGDASVETTGTLINVLDEDGNVVETYVYILFGDIDMDSAIGSADAAIAEFYEMNYEGFNTLYQFMAGDLDGDMAAGSADAATMEFYEMNYYGLPTQAENGAMVAANGEYVY